MRILIVDDDPHIRRLLRLYLRKASSEIHEAATGEEALALFDTHAFDVILLDLILPSFGGFRLCQRFKSGSEKSPHVIIITGDDSPETRSTAKECGADDFIGKPFSADEVATRLQAIASAA